MSRRNMNKLFNDAVVPSDDSDADFELQCLQPAKGSIFGELSLSSHSESLHGSSTERNEEEEACAVKVQKKKKKKRNKTKQSENTSSSSKKDDKMDEIDRSVKEVNALLGSPPKSTEVVVKEKKPVQHRQNLMSVQNKYLDSENELKKLMGPEGFVTGKKGGQSQRTTFFKRNMIIGYPDKSLNFHGYGLSMSVVKREGDITYFTYDHNTHYQQIHRTFLNILQNTNVNLLLSREQIQGSQHVEGMLEVVDSFFMMEEYNQAESLLEKTIACMQYATHPNFTFTNPNVRLEYKYLENRPFFTAVLKYIYLLSSKSCHRTALELGKMLLNLDPSDPLKMFLIIDILALRAREHQWLVDVIENKGGEDYRPELLISLKYSYALAKYHLAVKNHEDLKEVDQLLQDTILHCPSMAKVLLENFGGEIKKKADSHFLFTKLAVLHTGTKLVELGQLYTKMVSCKWREPGVLRWFSRNLTALTQNFTPEMTIYVMKTARDQMKEFSVWPSEVVRHLTVIKAMSDMVADGAVPGVKRGSASNPVPPLGSIDRYKYTRSVDRLVRNSTPIWHEFFTSAIPRNVNMAGVRPHWLMLRDTRDYLIDVDIYFMHVEGAPYLVVPCTLIVFSMYLLLVGAALKSFEFEYYDDPKEFWDDPEHELFLD